MRILLVAISLIACASCVFDYESVGSGRLGTGGVGGDGGSAGSSGTSGASGSAGSGGTAGVGGSAGSGGQGAAGGTGGSTGSSCTVATEDQDCNGKSCNPITLECSEFGESERAACETCVSDQNCWNWGHRCVLMEFDGKPHPNDHTGFCLPEAAQDFVDGPYHCNGEEPYVAVLEDRFSMSGTGPSAYCGVREELTTCDAVRAQLDERTCTAGSDDECPVGGICRYTEDNGKWDYRCTYECTSDFECRNAQGWTLDCAGYCGA